jgi:hypothetical protein
MTTPTHGPNAMIIPAAYRRFAWSYRHGVWAQQHGEPMRTVFGTTFPIWDQGDIDAYEAGYRDAEHGAIRQKGVRA